MTPQQFQQELQEEAQGSLLNSLPAIVWQRRWLLILPAILCSIAGVAAAYLMKPMYESSATVLIESQQLPMDMVNSPVTDIIDQRIAKARERVLSRQALIQLIRQNNLYPKEQKSQPLSAIVDQMRAMTTIEAVSADISSAGGVRSMIAGKGTIALRIAFAYTDPVKSQIIAQQYVNSFLEVDATSQTDQAVGAANFLNQQGSEIQAQIAAIEGQVSKIKTENGALLTLQNQSTGDPLQDASRIDSQIASLVADNSRMQMMDRGNGGGGDAVAQAEQTVRILRSRYSDTYPDVIAAQSQLDAARAAAAAAGPRGPAVNPVVAANNSQIASLRTARAMMLSQSASTRAAQARGPALAAQIDALEKRADSLRDQYREIGAKSQSAQISARMQTEQKGERLSLADPPVVPDVPYKPNRPVLIVGGIGAGIAGGLALIVLFELLLRPIRGTDALRAASGQSALVIVPDYEIKPHLAIRLLEKRNRKRGKEKDKDKERE